MTGSGDATRRLVGDVQRFGLLSAASVVDRFTAMVEEATGVAAGGRRPAGDTGRFVADTARLVEAYLRFLDSAAGLLSGGGGEQVPPARDRIHASAAAGAVAETEAWIHNTSGESGSAITFHASPLVGPGGAEIAAARIKVKPKLLDRLEPGESVRLRIRVKVPSTARPGTYHGVVLTSSPPAATIDLRLEVTP